MSNALTNTIHRQSYRAALGSHLAASVLVVAAGLALALFYHGFLPFGWAELLGFTAGAFLVWGEIESAELQAVWKFGWDEDGPTPVFPAWMTHLFEGASAYTLVTAYLLGADVWPPLLGIWLLAIAALEANLWFALREYHEPPLDLFVYTGISKYAEAAMAPPSLAPTEVNSPQAGGTAEDDLDDDYLPPLDQWRGLDKLRQCGAQPTATGGDLPPADQEPGKAAGTSHPAYDSPDAPLKGVSC